MRAIATRTAEAVPRTVDAVPRTAWIGVFRPTLLGGALLFALGITMHMTLLSLVERFTTRFPSIPDPLLARLPYVDFGWPGEAYFFAFVAAVTAVALRSQARTIPGTFAKAGLFYAFRGVFLFFLPIGAPVDAPAVASRFSLYPFPSHAFFPGGHVGLMTIMSLSTADTRWRRVFLAATVLFALGTMLSRTHYTADAIGGWTLAYAVTSWGRRHIAERSASHWPARGPAGAGPR
jgi:hypothetical protein